MRKNLLLIPDPSRPEESAAIAESAGACFEYNDFYDPVLLGDPARTRERIGLYRRLGRDTSGDTLHGAFLDVSVHSSDPEIRRISEMRVRQSMDAAESLGVRGVVFHTGLIPNFRAPAYSAAWLDRNVAFWERIAGEYPGIGIFLENMFDSDPDRIVQIAEAMRGVPQFGVCLDYAHAKVFGKEPAAWLRRLAPYIRHMHINDNDGLDDLHDAVGDGVIDWAEFDRETRGAGLTCTVLIETSSLVKQRRSIDYMREHGIYPFPRKEGEMPC